MSSLGVPIGCPDVEVGMTNWESKLCVRAGTQMAKLSSDSLGHRLCHPMSPWGELSLGFLVPGLGVMAFGVLLPSTGMSEANQPRYLARGDGHGASDLRSLVAGIRSGLKWGS